jgi:hypothetical protein
MGSKRTPPRGGTPKYPPLIKDRFFAFLTVLKVADNGLIPVFSKIPQIFCVFHEKTDPPLFRRFDPPRTPPWGHFFGVWAKTTVLGWGDAHRYRQRSNDTLVGTMGITSDA